MIWNQQLDEFLAKALNFQRTSADPCLYFKHDGDFFAILLIHVDYIIIAHNNVRSCDKIVDQLKGKWNITDLGEPSRVLGMQLVRDGPTGSIFNHQQEYINEILHRFNMDSCKPSITPHQPGFFLSKSMSPS